jgi:hypothetical protein
MVHGKYNMDEHMYVGKCKMITPNGDSYEAEFSEYGCCFPLNGTWMGVYKVKEIPFLSGS